MIRRADVENGIGFSSKNCEALKDLVKCEKLIDCFTHLHGNKQDFTFHRPGKAKSRLDRFYVSEVLSGNIVQVDHIPSLSDHLGVTLKICLDINVIRFRRKRNFSFWKINNQILEDDEFLPSFKALWSFLVVSIDNYNDIADWWDLYVKPQIKEFCIQFSSYRRDKRDQTKQLWLCLLKLMREKNNWVEAIKIKEKLNKMLLEDLMGVKVRSKHGCDLEIEKASLFHAAREQKNFSKVNAGLKIDNKVVTDKNIIETEVINFF